MITTCRIHIKHHSHPPKSHGKERRGSQNEFRERTSEEDSNVPETVKSIADCLVFPDS